MSFPVKLQKKITKFLLSLPNIHNANGQQAFIYQVGLDKELQDQIPFDKPSAQFIPILVKIVFDYGRLHDGRWAIQAVLQEAKQHVGLDGKLQCNKLLEEIEFAEQGHFQESLTQVKNHRNLVFIGIFIVFIIGLMSILYIIRIKNKIESFNQDTFGILVAPFEGSTEELKIQGRQAQYDLESTLNARFTELNITNAIARKFSLSQNFSLNNHENAREIGRKVHAELVIWGTVSTQGIIPNLTVVDEYPEGFFPVRPNTSLLKDSLSHNALKDLHDIRFPSLTDEPTLIVSFITALKYYRENKGEQALHYFKLSIPSEPSQYVDSTPIFFYIGKIYADLKKYDEAILNFTQALQSNSNHKCIACAYIFRGDVYREKGDTQQAIADYTNGLKAGTQNTFAYSKLAEIYEENDYNLALNYYSQAIEAAIMEDRESLPGLYIRRGSLYKTQKMYDQAIADFTSGIEISDSIEINNSMPCITCLYINRAVSYQAQKKYDQAIMDFNKLIKHYPKYAMGFNNYAWLLATCPEENYRDGKKALDLAEKALELDPMDSIILDTLAAVYAELGQYEKAVATQKKAIDSLIEEDKPSYINNFTKRLEIYQNREPYRSVDCGC